VTRGKEEGDGQSPRGKIRRLEGKENIDPETASRTSPGTKNRSLCNGMKWRRECEAVSGAEHELEQGFQGKKTSKFRLFLQTWRHTNGGQRKKKKVTEPRTK